MMIEKQQPHATEAEQSLLGAMLRSSGQLDEIKNELSTEDFYHPQHKLMYEAMLSLIDREMAVDSTTLTAHLYDYGCLEEIGGAPYILAVFESVTTLEHTNHYLAIVKEKARLRELIKQGEKLIANAINPKIDSVSAINFISDELSKLERVNNSDGFKNVNDYLRPILQELENPDKYVIKGLESGYKGLDRLINGFSKSELIILAARPSQGKSTLALNIARNVSRLNDAHVAFFSLEMSANQVVQKLVDSIGHNNFSDKARSMRMQESERRGLSYAVDVIGKLNISIDDTPTLEINQLRTRARRLHEKKAIDMIIIDYLQYVSCGDFKNNRVQEVSAISRSLKEMARELKIPVLALSQLSRDLEKRLDKTPILSDLRESGSIEQDGDKVIMLHREDCYRPKGEKRDGIATLFVRKNRNGRTGSTSLKFDGDTSNFENMNV